MKKMMFLAMMMVMTVSANAMSYTAARNEALFLSDKMAYELNLTDAQYNAVYEINLDYLMSVNGRSDVFGTWWNRRNNDLRYVLTAWQYDKYVAQNYFYRPVSWNSGTWSFSIYSYYTNRNHFYKNRPSVYVNYKGGNNHKDAHFYADRNSGKHDKHDHDGSWRNNNNNDSWRNKNSGKPNGNANTNRGHNASGNQTTKSSRSFGQFGNR